MIQQGQVFKLKAKTADGQALWAYRYRLEGRGSARPQVGGFASRADALKALEKVLERLGPGGRAATITLAELVDEYLQMHQAEQVTIAKLRWLLGTLRPPSHLRHVRTARRRLGVRGLAVHGLEHRDDRPPLRSPRPRQPRTRRLAARRSRHRKSGGRWVDVAIEPRKAAQRERFQAPQEATTGNGGRSVDVRTRNRRPAHNEKELISRNFLKPSNGLEPLTPSLPWRCSTN